MCLGKSQTLRHLTLRWAIGRMPAVATRQAVVIEAPTRSESFGAIPTWRGGVKLREITDGTSQTMMIGESTTADNESVAWSSDGDWGITQTQINFDITTWPACVDPATSGSPACWKNTRGFRSYHPGGVNFAFVDSAVKFISENIDQKVYRAISTRASDEVVDQGSY